MSGSEKPQSRILSAEFERSLPTFEALPPPELPEVAFLGRSNVGKSSLLNALCNRSSLAKTSKMPGRTQALNFFKVRFAYGEEKKFCHFVDLPGYGFAKVSKAQKNKWPKMIERYLLERENLNAVVLLIDCRRDPQEEERWIAEVGADGGLIVVLTKTDKISKSELSKRKKIIAEELNLDKSSLVLTSVSKKKQGITLLQAKLIELVI